MGSFQNSIKPSSLSARLPDMLEDCGAHAGVTLSGLRLRTANQLGSVRLV